jgi:NAD(P)-dependent dehydrogenase (short-subunit alcohol dehydrogenase family)
VYIADVLDEIGRDEASRLQADGLDVTYLHLDISDEDSWQSAMETIAKERGRLDVLVNNAGVIHVTPIAEEDLAACLVFISVGMSWEDLVIASAVAAAIA